MHSFKKIRTMTYMKSPVITNKMKWLHLPDHDFIDFGATELCRPIEIPLPEDIGYSVAKCVHLPFNIILYSGYYIFKTKNPGKFFPMGNAKSVWTEPLLMINSVSTGSGVIIDSSGANLMVGSSFGTLFQYAVEYDNTFSLELGEDIKFTTLGVTYSDMCSMIGKDDADNILHALSLTDIPSSTIVGIPAHITSLLHSCIPDHFTGKIGVLFTQARVLDYICALADYFLSNVKSGKLSLADRKLIQKIYDELSESSGSVPAISELSLNHGKSGKLLNHGFKELYGMSIFKFISEQRLAKAHDALLQTDIPMKTLAINLGYSDVNHFIYAFGKKFGYTPGSLRKNRTFGL